MSKKLRQEDCTPIPKDNPIERKKRNNTSKPKKKKKTNLQKKKDKVNSKYWRNKADEYWKEYIHKRGECAVNNKDCKGNLEAHHLISRSQAVTRHKPVNGILLCSNHHKFSVKCSPHKGPVGFSIWLKENKPARYNFVETNRYLTGEKVDYKAACERFERIKENG